MATECNRIAGALASALDGDAWYGDSLEIILAGVTADQARARPIANAHSIWELVLHVEVWVRLCLDALRGVPIPPWATMPREQDWPAVGHSSEQEWTAAVDSFFSTHMRLVEALTTLSDDCLDKTVPGRGYNFYHLFHGMIQHVAYHGGQMALLRKAIGD
jgi:DinB superfamily